MKKLVMILAALLAFNAAHAQLYVGGVAGFNLNANTDAGGTSAALTLDPEIGYSINDQFGVGAALLLNISDMTVVGLSPYVRYTFAKAGPVSFFADGAFTYQWYTGNYSRQAWEVGIYPGIAVPVSDKISLVGHLGNLSYDSYKNFNLGAWTSADVGIYFNL